MNWRCVEDERVNPFATAILVMRVARENLPRRGRKMRCVVRTKPELGGCG